MVIYYIGYRGDSSHKYTVGQPCGKIKKQRHDLKYWSIYIKLAKNFPYLGRGWRIDVLGIFEKKRRRKKKKEKEKRRREEKKKKKEKRKKEKRRKKKKSKKRKEKINK